MRWQAILSLSIPLMLLGLWGSSLATQADVGPSRNRRPPLESAAGAPGSDERERFDRFYHELKRKALERAPEIQAAQAVDRQKSAQVFSAYSRWLPRLDVQFSQSRGIDYSILASGALGDLSKTIAAFPGFSIQPQYVSLTNLAFNFTLPVYRRAVHLGVKQSLRERDSAEIALDNRKSELEWRLRQLVGAYLLQAYRYASLETSLEVARTTLREAQLRFKLGERTRVDVIRAEANLAALESRQKGLDQDLASSATSLRQYTGLTRQELIALKPPGLERDEQAAGRLVDRYSESTEVEQLLRPYLEAESPEPLYARVAEKGPQYRAILADQEAADARAKAVMAQEWPSVDVQGSLYKQSPTFPDAFTTQYQSKSLAVVLTIPIFTGGGLFSSYVEKTSAERRNEVQREYDVLRLKDEVDNTVIQIRTLRAQRDSQAIALRQNEELLRLSQRSYQLGKTTQLELQNSQNELLNAKLALAQTKVNLAIALWRLAWNLGVSQ